MKKEEGRKDVVWLRGEGSAKGRQRCEEWITWRERRGGSDGARREESLRMVRKEKDEMWTDWTHAARERQFVPALFTLEAMKGNNSR